VKIGTGNFSGADVNAQITVRNMNRIASLKLKLSGDGKRLEGTFHGLDLRETGSIAFDKIQ